MIAIPRCTGRITWHADAGYVIGFTQDPNVRAYLDGLNIIFMNAILRGSAHVRPVR